MKKRISKASSIVFEVSVWLVFVVPVLIMIVD